MVVSHADVLENAESIFRENGQRAIQRDQVRSDRLVVDAHEANRQAGRHFTGDSGLEQSDYALLLLAGPPQKDTCLLAFDRDLVGGHQRKSAPGQERRTEYGSSWWRHAAACALAPEGGDRSRMRQEEGRLFPHFGDQFVQVVGRGCAFSRLYADGFIHVIEQTVFGVVNQLALLALLDLFDDEAKLLFDLVVGAAVHIGDAGLQVEDCGDSAQGVLAWLLLIIDVDFRKIDIFTRAALDRASPGTRGDDLIHTISAGFDRDPLQEVDQPSRRDRLHHGDRFGDGRELARLLFVQGMTDLGFFGHAIRSSSRILKV